MCMSRSVHLSSVVHSVVVIIISRLLDPETPGCEVVMSIMLGGASVHFNLNSTVICNSIKVNMCSHIYMVYC